MNIFVFGLSMSVLYVCTLATPYPYRPRWGETTTPVPELITSVNEEETPTSFSTTVFDACNASIHENSGSSRKRRSIQYSFNDIITTESPPETVNLSSLSPEFLNCTHIYVERECYEKLDNGSVYVLLYSKMFDTSNYLINQGMLFICPDFFNEFLDTEKFSEHIPIVSLVCACISTVCIILHMIMFSLVKKLRNLPGYCLWSLCVALLKAYMCTFVQYKVSDHMGCTILGMFQLYYFLASFFWMNTMAYDVWKSIRMATAKLRLNTDRPIMVQFARYSLYAWGTPLVIILTSIVIHYSTSETSKYRLNFNISNCWFKYKQALTLYFAGPLFSLLVMNILFFVSSFYMISNAAMTKSQSRSQGSSDLWSRLLLSLRLGSVMGFMWIFGIIATITKQEWMWYLFSVCSALQGLFIFFSFTVSERARKACKKALYGRKCSVTPTQTSIQQTTSI